MSLQPGLLLPAAGAPQPPLSASRASDLLNKPGALRIAVTDNVESKGSHYQQSQGNAAPQGQVNENKTDSRQQMAESGADNQPAGRNQLKAYGRR